MRILLIGALSAPLIGCACAPSPQVTHKACTSKGCLQRTAAGAIQVRSAAFKPNAVIATSRPPLEAATNPTVPHDNKTDSPIAAKNDGGQPADDPDPVLKKARTIVASKMEIPASAEFGDMRRAMRTDVVGQSVDTICGHVKGKTASGEPTGERPFLYFVKDNVAFVDDGSPDSMGGNAYRNMCTSHDSHRQNFSQ